MVNKIRLPLWLLLIPLLIQCSGLKTDPFPADASPQDTLDEQSPPTPVVHEDFPALSTGLCGSLGAAPIYVIVALPSQRFAVGYGSGVIAIYNGKSGQVERRINAHIAAVASLALSPDGTRLASTSNLGEGKLWNMSDGTLERQIAQKRVWRIAFSPDGTAIAINGADGLQAVRLNDNHMLWQASNLEGNGPLSFSPSGDQVRYGVDRVAIHSAIDGALLRKIDLFGGSLAHSPDGNLVVSAQQVPQVVVRRLSDGEPQWEASPLSSTGTITAGAFSSDGKLVIIVSSDGDAVVMKTSNGQVERRFSLDQGIGQATALSPDGILLAAGLRQGNLKIWNMANSVLELNEPTIPGHTGPISRTSFTPDGKLLVSLSDTPASMDKSLKVWRLSDSSLVFTNNLGAQDGAAKDFSISPDGSLIAFTGGASAKQIYLLRTTDGQMVRTINNAPAISLTFSPDGKLLAGSGYFPDLQTFGIPIWRVEDGSPLPGFAGDKLLGTGQVAFSPDGRFLVSTSQGNTIPEPDTVLWNVSDRSRRWSLPNVDAEPFKIGRGSVAFSPDSALVVIGNGHSGRIKIYRSVDGALLADLAAPGVVGVAFSPTGKSLASVGSTGLRLSNATNFAPLGELRGGMTALNYAPDGTTIVAAGTDNVLRMFCGLPGL